MIYNERHRLLVFSRTLLTRFYAMMCYEVGDPVFHFLLFRTSDKNILESAHQFCVAEQSLPTDCVELKIYVDPC